MSFRMDVKLEKVLEDDAYDAKLMNVEQRETKFGERHMWTFEVDGERSPAEYLERASDVS